jgi:hypothetical protein
MTKRLPYLSRHEKEEDGDLLNGTGLDSEIVAKIARSPILDARGHCCTASINVKI